MKTHKLENQNLNDNGNRQALVSGKMGSMLKDNRPDSITQAKFANQVRVNSPQLTSRQHLVDNRPIQKKANSTGLPDKLKAGVENLSGHSLDDVEVHYNSSKPAQLQALAYAQGNQIHLAPGQEKHLPHEAWHVAQQKQGRVKPTMQMKGTPVNDDKILEKEADTAGDATTQFKQVLHPVIQPVVQRVTEPEFDTWYNANEDDLILAFGDLEKVKKRATTNLKKDLASITIQELNTLFRIRNQVAASGLKYKQTTSVATPYADTGYRQHGQPFGTIDIVFKSLDNTSVAATIVFTPLHGILPPNTVVGFLQTVKSPLVVDAAKERADAHSDKWNVDRQGVGFMTSPFFSVSNDGHAGDTADLKLGSESTPAQMTDTPRYGGVKIAQWNPKFETTAIIMSSSVAELKGSILAVINWEILIDSPNYKTAPKFGKDASHSNLPSNNFIEAVKIWNEINYAENPGQKRELVDLGVLQ